MTTALDVFQYGGREVRTCACDGKMCRLQGGDMRHGTPNGYKNLACRCDECRGAKAANKRAYREQNREKIAASDKAYRDANRLKVATFKRTYHEANRERILARKKSWRKANSDRYAEYYRRRAERVVEADHGCVTPEYLSAICDTHCAYCGSHAEHADHVVPLAAGGSHCIANIVPACTRCNRVKHAKPLDEWLALLAHAIGAHTPFALPSTDAHCLTAAKSKPEI